ncbi:MULTISPECIES: sel1 repeat family protein [Actinomadura]|uniref:sel1 repeat family protein n=1 Tax=Actinomadura TaxID=1988 RepID=UPI00047D5842|nr:MULTISPECIES: sel1 repeat family protein [Actinomadura]RSN39988.1 sel1 repeat family protein [Actinomadura sp. WAC 06369]
MPVRPWNPEELGRPTDGGRVDVAFGLGRVYELEGDLERAADWYRRAAESGHPGAPLRLGAVLGRLADARSADASDESAEDLLAEASRWLSGVQAATTPHAIELITDMLNRHQRQAARRGLEPTATG